MPPDIPSLIDPRIARGPIAKSNEAEMKPSAKPESLEAPNRLRRLSPKESRRSSNRNAEPIRPPRRREKRMTRRDQPRGKEEMNCADQRGISAETAPKIVIRPNTSVMSERSFIPRRFPSPTPMVAPTMIATRLMAVPIPGNIGKD